MAHRLVICSLSDNKGLELSAELFCALLLVVCELDGLTEVEGEDTEDRLAVHLISAGLKVNVTVKAYENVYELVNVVYFFKLNIKCHNKIPFFYAYFLYSGFSKTII